MNIEVSKLTYINKQLIYNKKIIFNQSNKKIIATLGRGIENVKMYRGNYTVQDKMQEEYPLTVGKVQKMKQGYRVELVHDKKVFLHLNIILDNKGRLKIMPEIKNDKWNRFLIRIPAIKEEHVYGCGEQLSYFDLRGHNFPLWTSEPGIGRNKKTRITQLADEEGHAGGNYYTTNFPQMTYISSQKYYFHTEGSMYAEFDFSNADFHEMRYFGIPKCFVVETAPSYPELIEKLTLFLGRQKKLPEWTNNGVILGLQGGLNRVKDIENKMLANSVKLAGLWCQDWEGTRTTSFGKRNYWNWAVSETLYPNLQAEIKKWRKKKIEFLAYINPYVVNTSEMFKEGAQKDYFVKNKSGGIYLVDFGEFDCGMIDLTNLAAFNWLKEIIKINMLNLGISGWMADFGEYLPVDVVLADGSDPMEAHNKWPLLWAKCNAQAVLEAKKENEILYFMRAGTAKASRFCPIYWAGDQSVDWSLDDGLASVICGSLSLGMSGTALTHSDIGGYTSMYGNLRTAELFERWTEMACFTPLMRTHEGNRPAENFQVYDDMQAIKHLAKFSSIYKELTPYRKEVILESEANGWPAQRPLFFHYEEQEACYTEKYEYLFGRDLLVAPVYEEGQTEKEVFLPKDEWIHLWSGKVYKGGVWQVATPLGQIPVFYRRTAKYTNLFKKFVQRDEENR